ncbi:MAG: tetratricopeptide repeat protein [Oscillospiraceae bacterium]
MDKWYFIKKLWQHFIIVVPLMFLVALAYLVIFDQPNYTPDMFQKLFFGLSEFSLFMSSVVTAYSDAQAAARRGYDQTLTKGVFKGFSKKARLFSDGMDAVNNNELVDGIDLFKEAMEYDCTDREKAVASFYIGNSYRLMGYHTNAAKYFRDSIDLGLDDERQMVYFLLARCYVENGAYQKALDIYDSLAEKGIEEGLFQYLYTDYGMCFLAKGDYEKAYEHFSISINRECNYVFALGGCSLAQLGMKNIELSRDFYAKALAANMTDVVGFKQYYCKIAESVGLYDKIDEEMKIRM